jgi:hypothetical protein
MLRADMMAQIVARAERGEGRIRILRDLEGSQDGQALAKGGNW